MSFNRFSATNGGSHCLLQWLFFSHKIVDLCFDLVCIILCYSMSYMISIRFVFEMISIYIGIFTKSFLCWNAAAARDSFFILQSYNDTRVTKRKQIKAVCENMKLENERLR